MRNINYNLEELKETRSFLRTHSTSAETALWKSLKNRQLDGRKFRRQFSVGEYVLDFYCPAEKLCIELDGQPHFTTQGHIHDVKRDKYLSDQGIRVARIENKHVFKIHEQVLEFIKEHFSK